MPASMLFSERGSDHGPVGETSAGSWGPELGLSSHLHRSIRTGSLHVPKFGFPVPRYGRGPHWAVGLVCAKDRH
jgi:hypothetical protein